MNDTGDDERSDEIRLGALVDATFIPDGVLIAAALQIEQLAEQDGWDQPASVYVALDVRSSGIEMSETIADELRDVLEAGNEVLALGQLGQIDGNPREELVGFDAPAHAVAIALVTESWTMPDDATADERATMRPSEHPRRIESRDVLMQTADGRLLWCRRQRGDAAPTTVDIDADGIKGPLIDVLRRSIGLGPREERDLVAELCRAVVGAATRNETFQRLPHSEPAMLAVITAYSFTIAACRATAAVAEADGEDVSELTRDVIENTDELLRSTRTAAEQRWQDGEEWLDDMMLWLIDNIPEKVLAHSIAVNLLGLRPDAADWWQPSYIAQFVADEYGNGAADTFLDSAERQRLADLAAGRLERLTTLRGNTASGDETAATT